MTTTPAGTGYPEVPGDSKDWTWVLEQTCPECGVAVGDVEVSRLGAEVRATTPRWLAVLERPDAQQRPDPAVWSPTEYAAHVRDVHRVFAERLRAMLEADGAQFANWDQDATAAESRYDLQHPQVVAGELAQAAEEIAAVFDSVTPGQEGRRGLRSNGSVFTVRSLGQYYLHDVLHHLWDVGG